MRRTSAGFGPRCSCSSGAWPGASWIASGPASTRTSIAAAMSSMPSSSPAWPKNPWSTATSMLAREGVALAGIEVGGEVRSAAIVLERSGRVTVMNEPGPELRAEDWERYAAAVAEPLAERRVLACTGGLPPGAPQEAYAQLAAAAAANGVDAIVDVTGERLGAAVAGGAAGVRPQPPRGGGPVPRP